MSIEAESLYDYLDQLVDTDPLKLRDEACRMASENERLRRALKFADDALRSADMYLDGFVWVTEPEFSELEKIKAASKRVHRAVEGNDE